MFVLPVPRKKPAFHIGIAVVSLEIVRRSLPLNLLQETCFDGLLQGLVKKLLGDGVSLPTFNTKAFLACGTATTLSNGNKVYKANANATLGFLSHYILQGDILKLILDKVDIFNDQTEAQLVAAFKKSSDDVADLVAVVLKVVLNSIGKKPA